MKYSCRSLYASQPKLTPHCLSAIFDLQLPSPKLSLKRPPKFRGPITHPKSRNTPKTACLRELFQKVRANFCLLPCATSQEPNGNYSDELFYFGWIFSGGFSSPENYCLSPQERQKNPLSRLPLLWGRVIARQVSGKNCLAPFFASRYLDDSRGPLGDLPPDTVARATCFASTVQGDLRELHESLRVNRPS